MRELVPDWTRFGVPERPGDDARIGDAALVDLALPAAERRIARHCPAPRVVVVSQWPADLAEPGEHLRWLRGVDIEHPHVVDGARGAAFCTGAIVGDDADDGVVKLTPFPDEVKHATDLLVGVRQEPREALHEASGHGPILVAERVPGWDPGRPRRERGRGWQQAHGELALEDLLAPGIPADVEPAAVVVAPAGRRLVRRVAGAGGEVEEERSGSVDGAQIAEELDGAVGQVLGQVITVLD